jgi:hypothetical protein
MKLEEDIDELIETLKTQHLLNGVLVVVNYQTTTKEGYSIHQSGTVVNALGLAKMAQNELELKLNGWGRQDESAD